jgi:DNA invertase Pin-like site-specific DNA recombinase
MVRTTNYATSVIPEAEQVVVTDAGVSAWSKSFAGRPGGGRIIEQVKPGDHVICLQIDRLCRNLRDFCNLMHFFEEKGIFVHFINNQINTTTASGKLQANILAAMAQYASDVTSERIREALLIKRLQNSQSSNTKPKVKWMNSEFVLPQKIKTERPTGTIRMYERVSTEPQYVSGLGLKWQGTANAKYAEDLAEKLQCPVGPVYSDPAISAFSVPFMEREAGKRLMNDLQPGDDVVIYRMDRGWRNTLDAMKTIAEIQRKGAYVHFVCERIRTDTGQGKEWISLMASIAQLESQMKSNRNKETAAWCQANGRPNGLPRAGFKIEQISEHQKRLAVDKKQLLQAGQIWVMKYELGLSTTQIEDMIIAIKARELGVKANLTMLKRSYVQRRLRQIDIMHEMIGSSLWGKCKHKARLSLKKPFSADHLRLIHRWKWTHSPVLPSASKPRASRSRA